jgi:hypothetical protein
VDDARAREGLEHLQAGVLELIAAARALLDVAEDLVRDPGTAAAVTTVVSTVARAVSGAAAAGRAATEEPADRERGGSVQRIRVS